jgi:RimJ/RimL family protein N-acetyltransferase
LPHYRRLVGEKCYLSPVCAEDADAWTRWANDLDVGLPLGDEAYAPTSLSEIQEWIAGIIRKQDPVFDIIDAQTDRLIGRVMLFGVNRVDRAANLGIVIGEKEYWGKGYGTEATLLMLDHAFNLMNLNSVMLGVFAFNQRALASYRKVGFREIGRRREARIIAEQRHDLVLMDLLADEFRATHGTRFRQV